MVLKSLLGFFSSALMTLRLAGGLRSEPCMLRLSGFCQLPVEVSVVLCGNGIGGRPSPWYLENLKSASGLFRITCTTLSENEGS